MDAWTYSFKHVGVAVLPNLPGHKYDERVQTFLHIFWHYPDGVAPPGRETRGLSRGQIDDQVQVLENEEPNLTSERA